MELVRRAEMEMLDCAKTLNELDGRLLEKAQELYQAGIKDGPDMVEIARVRGRLIAAIGALEKFYDNISVSESRGVEVVRQMGTNAIIAIQPNNRQSMTVRMWKGMDEWTEDANAMQTEQVVPTNILPTKGPMAL